MIPMNPPPKGTWFFACLAALCLSTSAFAIKEKDLWGDRSKELLRFFETEGGANTLKTADGLFLSYRTFTRRCGDTAIVLVTGRTEYQLEYAELVWDLYKKGFCVFTYDHRGQGLSSRLLTDTQKGHVVRFSDYLSDLVEFERRIVRSINFRRVFMIGASMGGLISAQFAATPESKLAGLVLVAPMFELRTDPFPKIVAKLSSWWFNKIGKGEHYAPKQGPWDPKKQTFERNQTTSSQRRFAFNTDVYTLHPEALVGGCTNRWLQEALRATDKSLALASAVKGPILLLQATKDRYVKGPRQLSFCNKATNCASRVIPNSKHEILSESDNVRDYALAEIYRFIETH